MKRTKDKYGVMQDATPLLTVDDVAGRLSVSTITIRRMIGNGQLKTVRVRRAIRISARSLDEWIERQ